MPKDVKYPNFYRRRGGEKDNHNNETSKPHTFHSKLSSKGKKYADFKGKINIQRWINVCFQELKDTKNGFILRRKKDKHTHFLVKEKDLLDGEI